MKTNDEIKKEQLKKSLRQMEIGELRILNHIVGEELMRRYMQNIAGVKQ